MIFKGYTTQAMVCAVVLGLLSGCGIVTITVPDKKGSAASSAKAGFIHGDFRGPECGQALYLEKSISYSRGPDLEVNKHVLLAACSRTKTFATRIPATPIEDAHEAFDDRRPSHVQIALMLWSCTVDLNCAGDPHEIPFGEQAPKRTIGQEGVLGLAAFYADVYDPAAARSELALMGLPDGAQTALLDVAERAKAHVLDTAKNDLDAVFHPISIEIPKAVFEARQTYFQTHARRYNRLDDMKTRAEAAIAARKVEPALIEEVEGLRSAYILECKALDCVSDPFYAEATRLLVGLHIARQDFPAAFAENKRFLPNGAYRGGFAQAVYLAQAPEAAKARVAWDKAKESRNKGLDEATINAALGADPARFTHFSLARPATAWPNMASILGEPPLPYSGYIKSVRVSGDKATVSFKSSKVNYDEPYDCRKTGRVSRINSDGRVEYETRCKWRKRTKTVDGPKPVEIPASEARGLKSGDLISVIKGDLSRVYNVTRGDKLVRVRLDDIEPICMTRKCIEERR